MKIYIFYICILPIVTAQRVAPGVPPQQYAPQQQQQMNMQQPQQQMKMQTGQHPQQMQQQMPVQGQQMPMQQQQQMPMQGQQMNMQQQQMPMQQGQQMPPMQQGQQMNMQPGHPPQQMQQPQMPMQQQQQVPMQQGHHQGGHHPHAPHGQQILNANVAQEKAHIAEHMEVPMDTSKMSEQELQFHYFKMHDADNNNKLDGCELIKSLIHWHEQGSKESHGGNTAGNNVEEKVFSDDELINLIDPILVMDDASQDGYIDYPEFVRAQNKANKGPTD